MGALVSGCSTTVPAECADATASDRASFGAFDSAPRARIGCLPFPGLMTLFSAADADRLGEHRYASGSGEVGRGAVYTERGGFLDIAHIRNTIDLTAYIHARVSHAMHEGWGCVRFASHEPSVYTVTLDYSAIPDGLTDDERNALIDETSVRLAQRLAIQATTWHEILTWYGYKSTVVFSEAGSAFTYEDNPSHAVGVLIAGEALRRSAGASEFDANSTIVLNETLWDLGVVDRSGLRAAISAVRGDWWSGGSAKRRMLETGLEPEGVLRPWLAWEPEGAPAVWRIPTLANVRGVDLTGLAEVEIEPRVFQTGRIMAELPGAHDVVVPDRDFPALLEAIRADIGVEWTRAPVRDEPETASR